MSHKILSISLLAAILLASCISTSPVGPGVPSIIPSTPTATLSIPASPAPHTQAGLLIEPYQNVRFQNLSNVDRSLGEALIQNWKGPINPPHKRINILTSRTTATDENELSYQFTGNGGLSWSVPYLTGVLAMGWQINPELTDDQLLDMIFASAYKTDGPADIINPRAFIDVVKRTVHE